VFSPRHAVAQATLGGPLPPSAGQKLLPFALDSSPENNAAMTRLDAIDPSTPSPEVHEHHEGPPPSPWLMAMEFRAFWEFGAIVPF
jgi:hypothetical protein